MVRLYCIINHLCNRFLFHRVGKESSGVVESNWSIVDLIISLILHAHL